MAAELKASHGLEATLVEGRGGVFVVRKDGHVLYDKAATGRFPHPDEVGKLLG